MQLEPMSGPQMPVKVWRMSSELCYGSLCQVSDYGYPDFYLKTEYSLLSRGRRRGITHRAGSCAHCNALALFFGVEVTSRCLIWNIHPKLLKVFFKTLASGSKSCLRTWWREKSKGLPPPLALALMLGQADNPAALPRKKHNWKMLPRWQYWLLGLSRR